MITKATDKYGEPNEKKESGKYKQYYWYFEDGTKMELRWLDANDFSPNSIIIWLTNDTY